MYNITFSWISDISLRISSLRLISISFPYNGILDILSCNLFILLWITEASVIKKKVLKMWYTTEHTTTTLPLLPGHLQCQDWKMRSLINSDKMIVHNQTSVSGTRSTKTNNTMRCKTAKQTNKSVLHIHHILCLKFLYYFFFSCEIESWGVLDTTLGKKVCQWHTVDRWFSIGTPVSFTIKSDRHDITEILLKVVLNTINLIPNLFCLFQLCYIWPVHTDYAFLYIPHFTFFVSYHFSQFSCQMISISR